jgi:GxxExxY protein
MTVEEIAESTDRTTKGEESWNHEGRGILEPRNTRNTRKEERDGESVILYKEESYRIMGACFEVYKEKGCGFLEAVYQECLEIELELRGIPFKPKTELSLSYKGRILKKHYEPDFLCFELIIMEIKAVSNVTDGDRAQLHNYLKGTNLHLGLLVNFGHHPLLEYERIAL